MAEQSDDAIDAAGLPSLTRRAFVAGGLLTMGCTRSEAACPDVVLRRGAQVPVGTCLNSADLDDPDLARLAVRQFSQITPDWEMKMGAIVGRDGVFRFGGADRVAAFARTHRIPLHGHTLLWFKHQPDLFAALSNQREAFDTLLGRYITAMIARYPARGWDVVNEPVASDGAGLRQSLWSQVLGEEDHIRRAFDHAAAAAGTGVPLFVNDYGLEAEPKRRTFMALIERLLRAGVPVGGVGTQTHVNIDLADGALTRAIRELGSLGLPVHVSEFDISFGHRRVDLRTTAARRETQARLAGEAASAFMALPPKQRYAFTLWGVRDADSWLRQPPWEPGDEPLAFDDDGSPKPMACALATALQAAGGRRRAPVLG